MRLAGIDLDAAVGDDTRVDEEDQIPAEPSNNSGVRIRSMNGWTLVVRTDLATRLVSLDTEDPDGKLIGSRILGTDDCQRLVEALHEALEHSRAYGGPVMIDVSQVIGRD